METAIGIAISFWVTLGQMAPYLVMGFLAAGLLSVVISPGLIERHLGGRGPWPVVKASLFGVPLPLCSCSVIPVAMSLSRHGSGFFARDKLHFAAGGVSQCFLDIVAGVKPDLAIIDGSIEIGRAHV